LLLFTGPAPAEPGTAGLLELIALSATCRALRAMLTAADDVWAPFLARLEVRPARCLNIARHVVQRILNPARSLSYD